jgi:hypothetical protein
MHEPLLVAASSIMRGDTILTYSARRRDPRRERVERAMTIDGARHLWTTGGGHHVVPPDTKLNVAR